jgi:hypothetical protein
MSSSLINITSSLQQQALHDVQAMPTLSSASGVRGFAGIV